jgi:hypothetical protein
LLVQLTSIQFMAYQKNNFYSGDIGSLTSLYTQISCVFPKKRTSLLRKLPFHNGKVKQNIRKQVFLQLNNESLNKCELGSLIQFQILLIGNPINRIAVNYVQMQIMFKTRGTVRCLVCMLVFAQLTYVQFLYNLRNMSKGNVSFISQDSQIYWGKKSHIVTKYWSDASCYQG